MDTRFLVVVFSSLVFSHGHAADIYHWVDEAGRKHFSDSVPAKYRNSATKVDSTASEITAAQRREAEVRQAQDKARAEKAALQRGQATVPSSPGTPAPSGGQAAGAAAPNPPSDCETLRRAYAESQACFAPYKMPSGVKAEAYQKCKVELDPSYKCGPAAREQ